MGFFHFFQVFGPQNEPKNENFKNSYTTFLDLPPRMLHAKFELPKCIFPKEDRFFRWKLTIFKKYFLYIIPYKFLSFRETTSHVCGCQMATAWNWETNEPILKTREVGLQHIYKMRKIKKIDLDPPYTLKLDPGTYSALKEYFRSFILSACILGDISPKSL